MDRQVLTAAIGTGFISLIAWTQFGRTAMVPCGLLAGLFIGLTAQGPDSEFLRGSKAGAFAAGLFVATITLFGAFRYRTIGLGFAIDWGLFTGFSMIVLVLPLFTMEGAVGAPLGTWLRRSVAPALKRGRPE